LDSLSRGSPKEWLRGFTAAQISLRKFLEKLDNRFYRADLVSSPVVIAICLQVVIGLAADELDPNFIGLCQVADSAQVTMRVQQYLVALQVSRERKVTKGKEFRGPQQKEEPKADPGPQEHRLRARRRATEAIMQIVEHPGGHWRSPFRNLVTPS
jgi:hypothetical protein